LAQQISSPTTYFCWTNKSGQLFFSLSHVALSLLPLARALVDLHSDAGRAPPPYWCAPPLQYSLAGGAPPDTGMVPPRPSPRKTARAGLPRRGGLGPRRWPYSPVQRSCSPARHRRLPPQRSLPGACCPPLLLAPADGPAAALLQRAARGRPSTDVRQLPSVDSPALALWPCFSAWPARRDSLLRDAHCAVARRTSKRMTRRTPHVMDC
jgi:hypothetical protein